MSKHQAEAAHAASDDGRFRRATRIDVFRPALLTLMNGEKVPAIIKNISDTGARIEFIKDSALTYVVKLSEPTTQTCVYAELVWDSDGVGGLQFLRPAS